MKMLTVGLEPAKAIYPSVTSVLPFCHRLPLSPPSLPLSSRHPLSSRRRLPSRPALASPLPPSPPLSSRRRLPSHLDLASPRRRLPSHPALACPLIPPSPAGLDNAGKTTIVMRFNGQDTSQVGPTLGFSITTLRYKGFNLNVWDVGGQRTLRAYWRNYFERTDGLVWVVDSCDRLRLADCRDELHRVLLEEVRGGGSGRWRGGRGGVGRGRLAGASLLVLANKQDLSGALSTEEMSKVLGLKALAEGRRHCHLVPCSAKTGEGVLRGFEWLVTDIASRIYMFD
ncbi:unnamed protein product [Closterium sp. Naga37s-1]|nr:unnamed protein product [Closterium sp. Naga37s-1]